MNDLMAAADGMNVLRQAGAICGFHPERGDFFAIATMAVYLARERSTEPHVLRAALASRNAVRHLAELVLLTDRKVTR